MRYKACCDSPSCDTIKDPVSCENCGHKCEACPVELSARETRPSRRDG